MSSKKDGANKTNTKKLSSISTTGTKQKISYRNKHAEKEESPKDVETVSNDRNQNVRNNVYSTSKMKTNIVRDRVIQKTSNVQKSNTSENAGSGRIVKSVFFPSKTMYKNALERSEPTQEQNGIPINKLGKKHLDTRKVTHGPPSNENTKILVDMKKNYNKSQLRTSLIKPKNQNFEKKSNQDKDQSISIVQHYKNSPQPSNDIKNESISDISDISERPRTATLRKGSIVNDNIVGPNASHTKEKKKVMQSNTSSPKTDESDMNYEDDFESYESDFEVYSSTSSSPDGAEISEEETSSVSSQEESDKVEPMELKSPLTSVVRLPHNYEERLDSGTYDMSESSNKIPKNLKKYFDVVNISATEVSRNNPSSLSDEGFEDQKSLQFINFLEAKKRYEAEEKTKLRRKRGEHILSMIKLDKVNFTLLNLPPVPYDIFIKTYGKRNTIQSSTQTGEDNVDEEIQTDVTEYSSKSTQFPTFSLSGITKTNVHYTPTYNEYSLNKFILSAGNLVLKIMKEDCSKEPKNRSDFNNTYFNDNYLKEIMDDIDEDHILDGIKWTEPWCP